MRVTTWLLLERFHIVELALLIESYLMEYYDSSLEELTSDGSMHADKYGCVLKKRGVLNWFQIAAGQHMELVAEGIESNKETKVAKMFDGACFAGHNELVLRLLESCCGDFSNGCITDASNGLLHAITNNRLNVVKTILDFCYKDNHICMLREKKYHFVESAIFNGHYEIAKSLYARGMMTRSTFIRTCGFHGKLELLKIIPDMTEKDFLDAACEACKNSSKQSLEKLMSLGPLRDADPVQLSTELIPIAARNNNINVVEFLLEKKADPNRGMEPACKYSYMGVVSILIAAGVTECSYCEDSIANHTREYRDRRELEIAVDAIVRHESSL